MPDGQHTVLPQVDQGGQRDITLRLDYGSLPAHALVIATQDAAAFTHSENGAVLLEQSIDLHPVGAQGVFCRFRGRSWGKGEGNGRRHH
ncbi:hypothetical protein D3C79_853250 [compost metagenome]